MSNIVEVVAKDRNLATLGNGMKAGGLEEELMKDGPYTVFAPTDLAFSRLRTGEWPEIMKPDNKERLTTIMNNYVVKGRIHFKDFEDGQRLTTLSGKVLPVGVANGNVTIDGAQIQGRDMVASNGVVHSVDKVAPISAAVSSED